MQRDFTPNRGVFHRVNKSLICILRHSRLQVVYFQYTTCTDYFLTNRKYRHAGAHHCWRLARMHIGYRSIYCVYSFYPARIVTGRFHASVNKTDALNAILNGRKNDVLGQWRIVSPSCTNCSSGFTIDIGKSFQIALRMAGRNAGDTTGGWHCTGAASRQLLLACPKGVYHSSLGCSCSHSSPPLLP